MELENPPTTILDQEINSGDVTEDESEDEDDSLAYVLGDDLPHEDPGGGGLDEEARGRVRQLAEQVKADPERDLSFLEYQQCVSSTAAQIVLIQDRFLHALQRLGRCSSPHVSVFPTSRFDDHLYSWCHNNNF